MTTQAKYNGHAKQDATLSEYVFGKVQPQALELEEAVLGAVMIDKEAILIVADILTPHSFYLDKHQLIYQAMRDLFDAGEPIDILTVSEQLRKNASMEAVGGSHYLVELTNRVASAANLEYHARIIAQKHIKRQLISFGTETIQTAYDETTDDLNGLEVAEKALFKIWQGFDFRGAKPIEKAALAAVKNAEAAMTQEGLVGVPSGITTIDRITGGWRKTDLIILAARPGMGKTSLALNMAYNAAKDFKKPVAVFSLEMSSDQLAHRLICSAAGVDSQLINQGRAKGMFEAYANAAGQFSEIPIYIDDSPGMSIFQMRAAARRLKMRHGIEMIVVDYLQLMEGENVRGQNREGEIARIARGLKMMAKELNIPVIALSQLSRAVEVRGGSKRPQLSDLRESGAIEQDADIVVFLYRPEYYGIIEDENGLSLKGLAETIFAKNRHGKLGTERVAWHDWKTTFTDIDQPIFSAPQFPTAPPPADSTAAKTIMSTRNDNEVPF